MGIRLTTRFAVVGLALAALGFAAAPAMAQRASVATVATLEAPYAASTRLITGTTVWNCEGGSCRTHAAQTANVRACRQLAQQAGRVTAYAVGDVAFTADQVASCNTAARPRS